MQKVWILGSPTNSLLQNTSKLNSIEFSFAKSLDEILSFLKEHEHLLLLAPLSSFPEAERRFGKRLLAVWPLMGNEEEVAFTHAIQSLLKESKLQHDLNAAESVAWSGLQSGRFEDSGIEFLGESVLEISACRNMEAVEKALLHAIGRIAHAEDVRVISAPSFLPVKDLGFYQLAVPVQYQNQLQAHVYVRFTDVATNKDIESAASALLNLGDAISLAVERNRMIAKAEQTKQVWEASFDAVADPVAILDEEFSVLRANRSFGKLIQVPISRIQGKDCVVIEKPLLQENAKKDMREWDLGHGGKIYRVFFDSIHEPLGAGRYVLRLHDVTQERVLTEKILSREQIAEMGILAGSVAHEINNPIGGIIAFSQILMKELPEGSQIHTDISEILQAAERCKRIVQTMLSLVRKADEEKKPTNVLECIHVAREIVVAEAKRLNTKIWVEETSDWEIFSNKNRIVQVFFHLLQQSLHAIAERQNSEKFSAEIRVLLERAGDQLAILIEDNGAAEIHVYDAGSSVAFAVSKMIVEEHGGSVALHCTNERNQLKIIFPLPDTVL